jgi:hypothetical protein
MSLTPSTREAFARVAAHTLGKGDTSVLGRRHRTTKGQPRCGQRVHHRWQHGAEASTQHLSRSRERLPLQAHDGSHGAHREEGAARVSVTSGDRMPGARPPESASATRTRPPSRGRTCTSHCGRATSASGLNRLSRLGVCTDCRGFFSTSDVVERTIDRTDPLTDL